MNLIQDLADECVRDDCGYDDPLPQDLESLMFMIRDNETEGDDLGQFLQDRNIEPEAKNLWQILAADIMRNDSAAGQRVIAAIHKYRDIWLARELTMRVDAAIDNKMGGWVPEPEEDMLDDAGGAL